VPPIADFTDALAVPPGKLPEIDERRVELPDDTRAVRPQIEVSCDEAEGDGAIVAFSIVVR
jgi:hypothetical protein